MNPKKALRDKLNSVTHDIFAGTAVYKELQRRIERRDQTIHGLLARIDRDEKNVSALIEDYNESIKAITEERNDLKEAADNLLELVLETQEELDLAKTLNGDLLKIDEKGNVVAKGSSNKGFEPHLGYRKDDIGNDRIDGWEPTYKKVDRERDIARKEVNFEQALGETTPEIRAEWREAKALESDAFQNKGYAHWIKAISHRNKVERKVLGFPPRTDRESKETWSSVVIYPDATGPLGAVKNNITFYSDGKFKNEFIGADGTVLNPPREPVVEVGGRDAIVSYLREEWENFRTAARWRKRP